MNEKKVSKVEQQKKKGRFNIYVKDEYAFSVAENVLIKFNIFKGRELDDKLMEEIKLADANAKALQTAYNYLSQQLRSSYEVKEKLMALDIEEQIIDSVLERLKRDNLIDDLNYAKSYVRTMSKTSLKGPNIITQGLIKKRINMNIIVDALVEYPKDLQLENAEKLYEQLTKRYKKLSVFARKQKTYQSLLQKGFTKDIIELIDVTNENTDHEEELSNLLISAEKIWQRNEKIEINKRKIKVKQSLYNKGFLGDDINNVLEKLLDGTD